MNKEEILAIKAGRELDALIAEQVLGAKVYRYNKRDWQMRLLKMGSTAWRLPKYSTNISVAWQVVVKLCNWEYDYMLILKGQAPSGDTKEGWWEAEIEGDIGKFWASGKTAEEAICKAALLAKLEEH